MMQRSDEGPIEARLPGYRFGIVLLLVFATFIFMSLGWGSPWVRVVTVALQGLTLLAAFVAAGVSRRLLRLAALVAVLALLASVLTVNRHTEGYDGVFFLLNALVVGAAPLAIAVSVVRRGVIDLHTVSGALCIYVLLGMMFAFVYFGMNAFGSQPFFAQQKTATTADTQYFSFVTLTTVGYGDLTAAGGLGRAFSNIEALFGQLYLVTVVAMLVSRIPARRRGSGAGGEG